MNAGFSGGASGFSSFFSISLTTAGLATVGVEFFLLLSGSSCFAGVASGCCVVLVELDFAAAAFDDDGVGLFPPEVEAF